MSLARGCIAIAFSGLLLAACNPSTDNVGDAALVGVEGQELAEDPSSGRSQPNFSTQDIGELQSVDVEATGVGPSPLTATDAAIYNAIRQTNGESVYGASAQYGMAANLQSTFGNADIESEGFAQAIVSASGGTVLSFNLPDGPPTQTIGTDGKQYWTVKIAAKIAKYGRPDVSMRPGLVVAEPRIVDVRVKDGSFSKSDYARTLKSNLVGAIAGTNRFAAMDRELSSYVDAELNSLDVRSPDYARVGKKLAAEVIVIPTIEEVRYLRSTRALKTSDREMVSYNAKVQVRIDVINGTTGHTIFSSDYSENPPVPAPSTLGSVADPEGAISDSTQKIVNRFVQDLLSNTFPVMVVSISGDQLVLNQGASVLKAGEVLKLVGDGAELQDPQTGQSLGAQETVLGKVQVDAVSPKTSIATYTGSNAEALGSYAPGRLRLETIANLEEPVSTAKKIKTPPSQVAMEQPQVSDPGAREGVGLAGGDQAEMGTKDSKDDSDW